MRKKAERKLDSFSKKINTCEEKLREDINNQLIIFEDRKQKKRKILNENNKEKSSNNIYMKVRKTSIPY